MLVDESIGYYKSICFEYMYVNRFLKSATSFRDGYGFYDVLWLSSAICIYVFCINKWKKLMMGTVNVYLCLSTYNLKYTITNNNYVHCFLYDW